MLKCRWADYILLSSISINGPKKLLPKTISHAIHNIEAIKNVRLMWRNLLCLDYLEYHGVNSKESNPIRFKIERGWGRFQKILG